MGLDLRPLGKAKLGYEDRFNEIFDLLRENVKRSDEESRKILDEFFAIQIEPYVTMKAPQVGIDKEATEWALKKHQESKETHPQDKSLKFVEGFYVVELAKEKDALPRYISPVGEKHVFRGQFLEDCIDLIGEKLAREAWVTKSASEALDYAERLLKVSDSIAKVHNLEYLSIQYDIPSFPPKKLESNLHIVYSLIRWLKFYAGNGHGYEACF